MSFRIFNSEITVIQDEHLITVSGVPANVMARDIEVIWATSKINTNMFFRITRSSFSFYLFFAPDIVFAINRMMEHRSTNTSIKILNEIKQKLISNTWLKETTEVKKGRLDFSKLKELTFKPLPFQQDFLEYYDTTLDTFKLKGALLAGAPGTGKTFCSLAIAQCLHSNKVVIVAPKNATERVWQSSIQTIFKEKQSCWVAQYGKPYNQERFIVCHYEALDKVLAITDKIGTKNVTVILDESHNLNEITSQRTLLFIELCKKLESNNVVLASGTPIKALGYESIPLFRVIDPYFTEEVESRFRKIYGKDATKALDILKHRFGIVSFKIDKKELNLAAPVMESIKVKMPNGGEYTLDSIAIDMKEHAKVRTAYFNARKEEDKEFFYGCLEDFEKIGKNATSKEYITYRNSLESIIRISNLGPKGLGAVKEEMVYCNHYENSVIIHQLPDKKKKYFKEVKTVIKYLPLKIQGECLGRVLGKKRTQCHVDMVPYVDFRGIVESTVKKTVVFTSFVEVLEACDVFLRKDGFKPIIVYGKTNNELGANVERFESNESLNPLIATYNSLSTAVPLIMADTMIMLNAPFRSYIQEQAISRIHRLGADTQTYVYTVALDTGDIPNISTRSVDILKWSQEMVEQITGVKSPFEIKESMESLTISAEAYGIEEVFNTNFNTTPKKVTGWLSW